MQQAQVTVEATRRDAARLADDLWKMAVKWDSFARESVAIPLVAAMDRVGMAVAVAATEADQALVEESLRRARAGLREAAFLLWRARDRALVSGAGFERFAARMARLEAQLDACLEKARRRIGEQAAAQSWPGRAKRPSLR